MKHAFIAALLLAAATALHAQTTPPADPAKPGARGHRMFDCSKAQDPKQCEERRSRMRDAHRKAEEACKDKQGSDRRACMGQQMCAQAKDPARCNEHFAKRAERHKQRSEAWSKAREACKGKEGDELRKCMRDNRPAGFSERHKQRSEAWSKAREVCKDKQSDEFRKCMRDNRPPRSAPKN